MEGPKVIARILRKTGRRVRVRKRSWKREWVVGVMCLANGERHKELIP